MLILDMLHAVGSIIFVGTVELVFFDTPRDNGNVSYCTCVEINRFPDVDY
jgi:hypothetical protein